MFGQVESSETSQDSKLADGHSLFSGLPKYDKAWEGNQFVSSSKSMFLILKTTYLVLILFVFSCRNKQAMFLKNFVVVHLKVMKIK
jgi:hypothetical protein